MCFGQPTCQRRSRRPIGAQQTTSPVAEDVNGHPEPESSCRRGVLNPRTVGIAVHVELERRCRRCTPEAQQRLHLSPRSTSRVESMDPIACHPSPGPVGAGGPLNCVPQVHRHRRSHEHILSDRRASHVGDRTVRSGRPPARSCGPGHMRVVWGPVSGRSCWPPVGPCAARLPGQTGVLRGA